MDKTLTNRVDELRTLMFDTAKKIDAIVDANKEDLKRGLIEAFSLTDYAEVKVINNFGMVYGHINTDYG